VIKSQELLRVDSCLNKALPEEMIFVLREKDDEAAETIRYWAFRRVMSRKNKWDDPKIIEALQQADYIDSVRDE
jgi:hypothetical protein